MDLGSCKFHCLSEAVTEIDGYFCRNSLKSFLEDRVMPSALERESIRCSSNVCEMRDRCTFFIYLLLKISTVEADLLPFFVSLPLQHARIRRR